MEKEQNVQPLISVIMPAHNAEKYITVAMESVFRQKGDFAIELYVVNDASTDNTERVVKDWLDAYKNRKEISKDCCNCELIYLKNEHNIGVAETRSVWQEAGISHFWMRMTGGRRTSCYARWR